MINHPRPPTPAFDANGPTPAAPIGSDVAPSGASRRSTWTTSAILLLLAAGCALTVLVFRPGYMTADARYLYDDMRAWTLKDWQSPAMGLLWRLIDPLAPGAWGMFLLTGALYWLGFGVLALAVARRSARLGVATPVLALAPPAFFLVGMIWRDVLFGAAWLVAAVLALAAAGRGPRVRLLLRGPALVLVASGVLLRQNAVFAAPVLAAYVAWPERFALTRAAVLMLPGALAFYALVPIIHYGALRAERVHPLHQIFVYDLGGITHFTGENQFPVSWDAEQAALLTGGGCYSPVLWDVYWNRPPCPFVMRRLERPDDVVFGTPRLAEAWRRAVLAHPVAYLEHRAGFMWNFLGRPNLVLPYLDWQGPRATYGANPYFRPLLALHGVLERTLLFRPGVWLVLAVAVVVVAWPARGAPTGAFAVGVSASAIVYVGTFFAVGVASDFRYAYWCVLATLAGGVAAVAARSTRAVPARSRQA